MSTPMIITIAILILEVALFGLCIIQVRKPSDPLRPRLLPYNMIMIFLAVAIMATLAHMVSLFTGHQLMPRRPKGMR